MKIYTRTGDGGETGLPGGRRVAKDAAVPECCGTIDELNATLGLVRAAAPPQDVDALLTRVQHHLLDLGAEVARLGEPAPSGPAIGESHVRWLEEAIDRYEAELVPLSHFILPGGAPAAAALHFSRTVCRRAERRLVALTHETPSLSPRPVVYLNRLSDLLFVLARTANARAGRPDVIWQKDGSSPLPSG
jgi:cob(I)alamin adenosyltransferase